jgi:sulfoxide reductase catalytic subunit YedY
LSSAGNFGRAFADTPGLYPAKRNDGYKLDGPLTKEADNTNYNNYYEYGTSKHVAGAAEALKPDPWTIRIDGLVEKPHEIALDDLLKALPLEERLYRHRCVEAWSMTVPWTGFPLKALVDFAKPLGSAKYVQLQTFLDPKMAPGQKSFFYPWPYVEGVTLAEAANDLAFLVTGAYGKPLPKVMGAPLRLALPWKYGFKSVKSIAKISFVEARPKTFWQALGPDEYGFWANVNPEVPHPRWSQATEEVLGTGDRKPTLLYNGYAEQVASLYANVKGESLFM